LFFPWGGGVGGVFFFFHFLVPNVFLTCSHHIPLRLLKFTSCSLRHAQYHLNFIPYGLPEVQFSRM
jgi:hypothetical protein